MSLTENVKLPVTTAVGEITHLELTLDDMATTLVGNGIIVIGGVAEAVCVTVARCSLVRVEIGAEPGAECDLYSEVVWNLHNEEGRIYWYDTDFPLTPAQMVAAALPLVQPYAAWYETHWSRQAAVMAEARAEGIKQREVMDDLERRLME